MSSFNPAARGSQYRLALATLNVNNDDEMDLFMSLACVYSRARIGLTSPLVTVEVHIANGLPAFAIVGLPETSVKEAKDRVRSAILNCGYEFPAKRITINLAPLKLIYLQYYGCFGFVVTNKFILSAFS